MNNPIKVPKIDAGNLFFVLSLVLTVDISFWFQKTMYQTAGHDSWIPILIACPITLFVAWVIYITARRYPNNDLYWINRHIFGKWGGMLLNTLFAVYQLLLCGSMLRNIQEIIVNLIFPDLPGWLFMSGICALLLYGVYGGIRVIVGFIVIYFMAGQLVWGLLIFPIKVSKWDQLLPIMEASPKQLLAGTLLMLKYNLGVIQLYFLYPFVQDKNRINRYTQLSVLYAVLSAMGTLILSIVYYGGEQLALTVWPHLTSFRIIKLTVLERFDILVVAYLVISVFSASLILIWSSTRGYRDAWKIKQKYALFLSCVVLIIISEAIHYRTDVESFSNGVRSIGIWYEYVYPLFLYICVYLKRSYTLS